MALMADQEYDGFSKPDFAIFADTGWEPKGVYEHLDWLETQLSYPVIRVSAGNIKDCVLNGQNPDGQPFMDLPVHVVKADGKHYIGKRQCTNHFKLKPIRDYLRQRLDAQPGKPIKDAEVVMWLGISRDEASRQKPSREPWIKNVYPLLEHDMSRAQLELWFQERYPERSLPKSACIGCPYHTDRFWANMKANDPESWNDAVGVDWALRNNPATKRSIDGAAYLHRSRQPLNQVELAVSPNAPESNEMDEECEGLCGV